MVEFTDKASIEAWCRTRPFREVVTFAALTGASVMPAITLRKRWADHNVDLFCYRAMMIAMVRGYDDVDQRLLVAARQSFGGGFSSAGIAAKTASHVSVSASGAIQGAVNAALSAGEISLNFRQASQIATRVEATGVEGTILSPLWREQESGKFGRYWSKMTSRRLSEGSVWGFWIDWYEGLLEGRAPDWELWREVALIPNNVWEAGPEAVAKAIISIKRRRMVRAAPPLVLDQASQVFQVSEPSDVPEDVFAYAKSRVEMAFKNALAASQSNGFTESSYEAVTILSALDAPKVRADVLAGAFYDAALGFMNNIGEVYPDDVALVNLKNVLYAASEEICELDENARLRCLRIAKLQIEREPSLVEIGDLGEMVAIVEDWTDAEVAAILQKDKDTISRALTAPKWVKARFMQYMTTIGDHLERAKKGDARVSWLIRRLDELWEWFKTPE